MTTDPVCEVQVDERKTPFVSSFEGHSYFFDSASCQHEFDQDPRRYAGSLEEILIDRPGWGAGGEPPEQSGGEQGPLR